MGDSTKEAGRCAILMALLSALVLFALLAGKLKEQDFYIQDLQRRIGEMEQHERKH